MVFSIKLIQMPLPEILPAFLHADDEMHNKNSSIFLLKWLSSFHLIVKHSNSVFCVHQEYLQNFTKWVKLGGNGLILRLLQKSDFDFSQNIAIKPCQRFLIVKPWDPISCYKTVNILRMQSMRAHVIKFSRKISRTSQYNSILRNYHEQVVNNGVIVYNTS